jgi:hypothetical protein
MQIHHLLDNGSAPLLGLPLRKYQGVFNSAVLVKVLLKKALWEYVKSSICEGSIFTQKIILPISSPISYDETFQVELKLCVRKHVVVVHGIA